MNGESSFGSLLLFLLLLFFRHHERLFQILCVFERVEHPSMPLLMQRQAEASIEYNWLLDILCLSFLAFGIVLLLIPVQFLYFLVSQLFLELV
jgi:hypothetical protein